MRRLTGCLCAFVLMACSDAEPEPVTTIVVDRITRCTAERPAPTLEPLPLPERRRPFFDAHPLATLQKHDGPVMEAPRLVGVFFEDDPLEASTLAFLESYGCTSHWRDAVNEYGIGDALLALSVELPVPDLTTAATGLSTELEGFRAWLSARVDDGALGEVTGAELVIVFMPPGAPFDNMNAGGFHDELETVGGRVRYAVVFQSEETADVPDRSVLDSRTFVTSHEMLEAATDPLPGSNPAWAHLGEGGIAPSVSRTLYDEVSDLCFPLQIASLDYPFRLAVAYSNRRAEIGADPCSSSTPIPFMLALHDGQGSDGVAFDPVTGVARLSLDVFVADYTEDYVIGAGSLTSAIDGATVGDLIPTSSVPTLRDGQTVSFSLKPLRIDASIESGPFSFSLRVCRGFERCYHVSLPVLGPPPPPTTRVVHDAGMVIPDAGEVDSSLPQDAGV